MRQAALTTCARRNKRSIQFERRISMFPLHIDPNLAIPIYQQLTDAIRAAIRQGTLIPGEQLPTVQELAEQLHVARGTIKRAYDELERQKLLEKVQGRGTFVTHTPAAADRKDRAMAAIDELLDQLQEMKFSMHDIRIFLDLKLRQRAERLSNVKVAVVECNPETLSQLTEQLRQIEHVSLYSCLLEQLKAYPYNLAEEADLVVSTPEHVPYLETIVPERKKIARIALRLSRSTMSQLVKLQSGETVGILCNSLRFGELVQEACAQYTENVQVEPPVLLDQLADLSNYLQEKTAVLVPDELEKYTSDHVVQALSRYARRGKLIRCSYQMDDGSFLYVEERIGRLWEKKSI